jgi:predicted O-linked N-acetylglucosamine transferase (SPINDLY family)
MTDAVLSAKIAADGIDILVDLSGHSAGNRLLTFARKPAPVQVTAWGYATGTGLPTIDYFFSDPVATPAAVRPLFAETVYDLPCFLTFAPPPDAPPVSEAPVQRRGFITFGCLNGFHKVSKSNLELWAQILQAVAHSRLLLKDIALAAPSNQALVKQTMAKYGIDPERIELRGGSSHRDHLAAYGDVDIALDPFPYNGGITTWEALWMGVPVVSKLGNSSSGRSGGAILSALGLRDWVVSEAPDYLVLAAAKAAHIDELARFRREIRAVISSSAAGNPALYTRAVETAYLTMWHDYATNITSCNR